jgi:WD40 repeat protein
MHSQQHKILCGVLNEDKTVMALGMTDGFVLYSAKSFKKIDQFAMNGGVGMVAIHDYSNLFALRGGGKMPFEPKNRVVVYDGLTRLRIAELTFETVVKGLRISDQFLIVQNISRIFFYSLCEKKLQLMTEVQTHSSLRGALDFKIFNNCTYVGFPLLIKEFDDKGIFAMKILELNQNPILIRAFSETIEFIKFDATVERVALYSESPQTIKIFEILKGALLHTLKRSYISGVTNIEYSPGNDFLIICDTQSDCEIFNVSPQTDSKVLNLNLNRRSKFRFLSGLFASLGWEWSFANLRNLANMEGVAFFSNEKQFTVVSFNGVLQRFQFDILYGGECLLKEKNSDFLE